MTPIDPGRNSTFGENMENRIVCWFSCGAASAVATKLAIAENAGRLPIVIARCIVREEHPDNDRFAADCERWFGVPITNLINEEYDGSIYEVFRKKSYIAGIAGAPCTRLLKKEVRHEFELPTDRQVFGYCAEEQGRWDRFLDANNISAVESRVEEFFTSPAGKYLQETLTPSEIEALWLALYRAYTKEEQSREHRT